jgi:predicted DNA-binding ribbon-helix-helix protein
MRSPIVKRSVVVCGHNTSVSLEDEFWQPLHTIASRRKMTLGALLDEIDGGRQQSNLSSHIRLFVLEHYRAQGAAPAQSALPC